MRENIKGAIWSFSGLSIGLGVLGALSGVVQLFVDVNKSISVKWLLLVLWISISILLIFLKLVFDATNTQNHTNSYVNPFKFIPDKSIFIIKKNDLFLNNIIVGCYSIEDDIENLAFIGVVSLVQEKIIQIKIIKPLIKATDQATILKDLKKISIRPVIPYDAILTLNSATTEESNE